MFYSQFLLSKKGPLGVIWIAAHLQRKLRKKQITDTDIGDSVDTILYSEVPIALRISSHLLLGVVRIYARKVDYLFHDCSDTLVKIRQAFQTSAINLPPKAVVAPYHTITLPESFDFEDLGAYINPEDAARAGTWAEFEHHVIDRDLITLHEPMEVRGLSESLFTLDGGFAEGPNPYTISASLPTEDEISRKVHVPQAVQPVPAPSEDACARAMEDDVLPPLPMEEDVDLEDMDNEKERNLDIEKGPEIDRALEDVEIRKVVDVEDVEVTRACTTLVGQEAVVEVEETRVHREAPSPMDIDIDHHVEKEVGAEEERRDIEEVPIAQAEKSPPPQAVSPPKSPTAAPEDDVLGAILGVRTPKSAPEAPPTPPKQHKRKRKLIFDNLAVITTFNMKKQLGSSSHLVRLRKKAPCTEYQIWMSQRVVTIDQKFSGPSLPGMCPKLKALSNFIWNLKPEQPDKDLETGQEPTNDQIRVAAKGVEGRADVDSDVEELFHEGGEHTVEIETISTVKKTIEGEVVSTPPPSPQPREAGGEKIQIEAVSSVKRRLEFEKPIEQLMERDGEAQQAEPSPSRLPAEDVPMAADGEHVPIISVVEGIENQVVPDGGVEERFPDKVVEFAQSEVGPSKVITEEILIQQQREITPPLAQTSEDSSDQLQSHGLGFLADSKEAENGTFSYSSSFDTDSEHFGKFMQDKSGWASRTRAVALYLKEKFEAQGLDEQCMLSLGNILKGRRRKEAARMFFEISVLRSKDYIQVEQPERVLDIFIGPTEHLMKGSW